MKSIKEILLREVSGQRVWVLEFQGHYEGGGVAGVYSSRELAEKAMMAQGAGEHSWSTDESSYDIVEHIVDKGMV